MLMMPHQRIPHVLAPPRPPQVAARFKDTPHPRELLALGARVEETPLRVGKWRGKGAKTLRYVLSLPEEQAVEYRGRLLQELTLKVAPSGKGEVERTAEHPGASYATLIQASIGFWQGDPALVAELEQVFPLLVRKETPLTLPRLKRVGFLGSPLRPVRASYTGFKKIITQTKDLRKPKTFGGYLFES